MTTRFTRTLCALLYYGFARHLPSSYASYSLGARYLRALLCKRMFLRFGHHVNIEHGAVFTCARQSTIGNYSGVGIHCRVGLVAIGNDVMMGNNVLIISENHEFTDTSRPMREQKSGGHKLVIIEDDVWIGSNVIILPGRKIGRGSVVGAGAVVTKDVQPFCIVGGNPARVIGLREAEITNGESQNHLNQE